MFKIEENEDLSELSAICIVTHILFRIYIKSEIVIPQNCGSRVWPYLGTVVMGNELGLILKN